MHFDDIDLTAFSSADRKLWAQIRHQLSPIERWLTSPTSTEVMVNFDGAVFVDSHDRGMWETGDTMSVEARAGLIRLIARGAEKIVDDDDPEVGDTIPVFGARFQGVLPPAAPAPFFSIRIPNTHEIPVSSYIEAGTLTTEQAEVLGTAIHARQNILVAGGTGSGKTTFCNALLGLLRGSGRRIMLIEDTPELRCPVKNLVPVRVNRQSGFDYTKALFVALRLRPDSIVVGELRDGAAALELLKSWNTGHNGGLSTIHANSSGSTLPRIEQLLEEVVAHAPKALIAEAINVIVYLERYTDPQGLPRRRVLDVARVVPELDGQGQYVLEHRWHPSVGVAS